jgi:hypothetical protein
MRSIDGPYLVLITSTERGGGLVKQMLEEKKEKEKETSISIVCKTIERSFL